MLSMVAWGLTVTRMPADSAAAAVCALIAYWSKLEELCESAKGKLKRNACISEYDDYEE